MHGTPARCAAALLVGVASGLVWPIVLDQLPDTRTTLAVALVMCACAWIGRRRVPLVAMAIAAACCGGAYTLVASEAALARRGGACIEGIEVVARGRIEGLPVVSAAQVRLDFVPDPPIALAGCTRAPIARLRLTWYEPRELVPGEPWVLRIRLRSVRGFQNPGAFDYEAFVLARGIDAAGTVKSGRRIAEAGAGIDRWRQRIAQHTSAWGLEHHGILLALTTGDASAMRDTDWDLFQRTGTVHLMVISGLHVSLVAACGYFLGKLLARASHRLMRRVPARSVGAAVAVTCATAYSGLAGAGIPVQRAWIMAVVAVIALCGRRRVPASIVCVVALVLVLVRDPLGALEAGFWLSFGAVAVLLAFFVPRGAGRSPLSDLVSAQAVLFAAMLPISAIVLGQIAWIAPVANLFAVPVTSLAVVPLVLAGALAEEVPGCCGPELWSIADLVTGVLLDALRSVDVGGIRSLGAADLPARTLAAAAALLVLLPLSWRMRTLVMSAFLPLLAPAPAVAFGEFRVIVLDVGQGEAVIVDTARHRLLYDAGPRYLSGFDLGRAVVIPAVRATGVSSLDVLMLSHGDLDHIGGAGAVVEALHPRAVVAGSQGMGVAAARPCRAGQTWQWDGVTFRVLHPGTVRHAERNDESCVLEVRGRGGTVLLAGDIGIRVEREVARHLGRGRVDLLVIPHHGSRSSSSPPFVRATRPVFAVASAGHANRFGHPHADVVSRYRTAGSAVLTTAASGAVTWSSATPDAIVQHRFFDPPYWRVGGRLSMNQAGIKQRKNTAATIRNVSRNAIMLP